MKVGDVVNEKLDVIGRRWIVTEIWTVDLVVGYGLRGISPDNYGAYWLHNEDHLQIDANQRCEERRLIEIFYGS